jgi:uncharacterized alpha-E superfamily protein
VLSRIAEALYWIGRYTERAEDTARILDVHYHLLLEDRWIDEAAACAGLLEVMGIDEDKATDSEAVTRILAFGHDDPGSIVNSLAAAWRNARGARDAMSSEMWECLNATHQTLAAGPTVADEPGAYAFFHWVKDRAATFAGLAESTMSRDDGWRFLLLGRSLERVDMTARLLSASYSETWGEAAWTATLQSCGAYEAYLRTYQRTVDGALAAEFLVLDRLFPRSVFAALGTAETCLAELGPASGRAGPDDEARRCLGRARTELEFCTVDDLADDLPGRLRGLQRHCSDAASAIAGRYFHGTAPLKWT